MTDAPRIHTARSSKDARIFTGRNCGLVPKYIAFYRNYSDKLYGALLRYLVHLLRVRGVWVVDLF